MTAPERHKRRHVGQHPFGGLACSRPIAARMMRRCGLASSERTDCLQTLADCLCAELGMEPCAVKVLNRPRPKVGGNALHGYYSPPRRRILVYNLDSRGRRVGILEAYRVFLHEFIHHYDHTKLGLPDSEHTPDFQMRVQMLRRGLSPMHPLAQDADTPPT